MFNKDSTFLVHYLPIKNLLPCRFDNSTNFTLEMIIITPSLSTPFALCGLKIWQNFRL